MTTIDDLPASAVRLITRFARTRRIPGTNRFARVCRSWRGAAIDSADAEQVQLLLALEGLSPDTVTTTRQWLAQHGACVTSLDITYDPETSPLFEQLPLATAPLVGLARLEVDGPDSLVALAPALPQLVALTHLRASIGVVCMDDGPQTEAQGVFAAEGAPLEDPPCLQQLCPGLKSLHLDISCEYTEGLRWVEAPMEELLPDHLEQLHMHGTPQFVMVPCAALAPFTLLRRLTLKSMCVGDPDELLAMPGLAEVDMLGTRCYVGGSSQMSATWLREGRCTAKQHLAKLTYMRIMYQQHGPPSAAPSLATLSGLRKLEVCSLGPGAAACVHQLSSLSRLQSLSLDFYATAASDAAAVLSAVSSVQQLTPLFVYTSSISVPRSTWAALLPHLPQLRVLGVSKQLLEGGLADEVHLLTQLQCLYVSSDSPHEEVAAVTCASLTPYLPVLSKCSSLKAVLYYRYAWDGHPAAQPLWEYVHQGRLHLSGWHKWRHAAEEGRVVWPRPCPHLPGVWELQQEQPTQPGSG
jgi:hypothetical protein